MSSIFGKAFTVTTFGESHGMAVGAVVDGCPARLPLSEADIQPQLNRRRPGQNLASSPRNEPDSVSILSGVADGMTLGSPIALQINNTDTRPRDYSELDNIPRPSHADYTYRAKYGISAKSGGGRASARETAARVAAGAIAEKFLQTTHNIKIVAWVSSLGGVTSPDLTEHPPSRTDVDGNIVRCPDQETAQSMLKALTDAKAEHDSLGGIVTCVCRNVPIGLGEPIFDKLDALLAHAMLSLPAVKGFEVGSGFASTGRRGSENNDPFTSQNGILRTLTNHSGGIQGGLSNGMPVVFRVAFKPTSSIARAQNTVDYDGNAVTLQLKGRHDPCLAPRAVPVVEAMTALVLADAVLRARNPLP